MLLGVIEETFGQDKRSVIVLEVIPADDKVIHALMGNVKGHLFVTADS